MQPRLLLLCLIALAQLPACTLMSTSQPRAGVPQPPTQSGVAPAGNAQPALPGASGQAASTGGGPGATAAHPTRFGAATSALVAQARQLEGAGNHAQAAATLERALRIEPENPLLWVELGRIRLAENNAVQADAMGRKALAVAAGDADAEASAWRLIADAMRASGRTAEASEADRHAAGAAPR